MKAQDAKIVKQGEIYYYDFGKTVGSVQNGYRPILVVQSDNFNSKAPTVIVAAITTVIKKGYLPSHIYLGKKFGLRKPSMLLLEQIRTINKSELQAYIGFLNEDSIWEMINTAVKKTFGLYSCDSK